MGMYLLERARENGTQFFSAALSGIETSAGRVTSVRLKTDGDEFEIRTDNVVLSTGPYFKECASLLGVELPVAVEKHIKISLPDPHGAIPREAPLIIWTDPITLDWSDDEREALSQSEETQYLLEEFPAGVHGRPVGAGDQVLMYWTYDCTPHDDPTFPLDWDPYLPDITLRGMARLVPGLERYFDPMPKPYRRRILYEDRREPTADRTVGAGRLRLCRVLRLRHHGVMCVRRITGPPRRRNGVASICGRIRSGTVSRPFVSQIARILGFERTALMDSGLAQPI